MMATRPNKSRRAFLSSSARLALAGSAAAGLATAASAEGAPPRKGRGGRPAASGAPPRHRKQVVAGSPSPAYSRAVKFGDLVFVAGCVGTDKNGVIQTDFETEAGQALLNLKESVERSGSSMDNVLKCTCFLKDYEHFAMFNKVYMKFFPKQPPARSTVVVKDFVVPGAHLEIDCVCCTVAEGREGMAG